MLYFSFHVGLGNTRHLISRASVSLSVELRICWMHLLLRGNTLPTKMRCPQYDSKLMVRFQLLKFEVYGVSLHYHYSFFIEIFLQMSVCMIFFYLQIVLSKFFTLQSYSIVIKIKYICYLSEFWSQAVSITSVNVVLNALVHFTKLLHINISRDLFISFSSTNPEVFFYFYTLFKNLLQRGFLNEITIYKVSSLWAGLILLSQ